MQDYLPLNIKMVFKSCGVVHIFLNNQILVIAVNYCSLSSSLIEFKDQLGSSLIEFKDQLGFLAKLAQISCPRQRSSMSLFMTRGEILPP